jgi:hypothetical protein
MITTSRTADYVLNHVEGKVTIRELLEYAQRGVSTWATEPVLWDLTAATLAEDESDYITLRSVIGNIHEMAEQRKGRKTTFVAPDPCTYGMLRMALAIAECYESRFIASVWRDLETAVQWLRGPGSRHDIDTQGG